MAKFISNVTNKFKDYSIFYSFDRSGYERHERDFQSINNDLVTGKTFLVTGGTSGIGAALAERLVRAGAKVTVTGRNEKKFIDSDLSALGVEFVALDMCDFDQVKNLNVGRLDGLVCNAGGMPHKLTVIDESLDVIFASQVIGHYVLIKKMIESENLQPGAPIHITSSGGMYLSKLKLDDLSWQHRDYDKASSYANAKRAQVILNEELASQYLQYHFSCSHPGWVGTEALKEALPNFVDKVKNRLRTSEQGADTIFWCLAEATKLPSGKFWFDRKSRPTTPFFWTKESFQDRKGLFALCDSYL